MSFKIQFKSMTRILATAVILMATCLASEAAEGKQRTVRFLHIADTHAQLETHREYMPGQTPELQMMGGFARPKTALDKRKSESTSPVFVADSGDAFQGSGPAAWREGEAILKPLNALGLDVFVPGNWEPVYGPERFKSLMSRLTAKVIAYNFHETATGTRLFEPTGYDGARRSESCLYWCRRSGHNAEATTCPGARTRLNANGGFARLRKDHQTKAKARSGGRGPRAPGLKMTYYAHNPSGKRIVSIKVAGEEIKDESRYELAGCEREGEAIDFVCRMRGVSQLTVHQALLARLAEDPHISAKRDQRVAVLDLPPRVLSQDKILSSAPTINQQPLSK